MAITKVQLHGVADTAGELEDVFHRIGKELTKFIGDDSPNDDDFEPMRDKEGNVQYALSDLKFTPKLNQGNDLRRYVIGHATYTIWWG